MADYTVLDLITAAALLDGIIQSGETLSPEEYTTGFICLLDLIDEWNGDRLNIFTVSPTQYQLSAKQAYTIGPGAEQTPPVAVDFEQASRPICIQSAAVIIPGTGQRKPLGILDAVAFSGRSSTAQDGLPEEIYCDYAWPIATLKVTPIPTAAPKVELYTWNALTTFAAPTDVINFPPTYRKAIRYNLALLMAAEFEAPVRPDVAAIAAEAKEDMRRLNAQFLEAAFSSQMAGRNPSKGIPMPASVPTVTPAQG